MRYDHSIQRARERYRMNLAPQDINHLREMIRGERPEVLILALAHDRDALLAIRYRPLDRSSRTRWLSMVWRDWQPITVLPPISLRRYGMLLMRRKRELKATGLWSAGRGLVAQMEAVA